MNISHQIPFPSLISYIKCIIFCDMVRNVEDKEEMINVISSGRLGILTSFTTEEIGRIQANKHRKPSNIS